MSSIKRNLIIFQTTDFDSGIDSELLGKHWNIYIVNNLHQVSKILFNNQIRVGLCLIDKCSDKQLLNQVNQLFNKYSHIFWIVGLPKECSPEVSAISSESQLILDYGYEYVTFPIDAKRLLFALGYAHGIGATNALTQDKVSDYPSCYGIIGDSLPMQDLFRKIRKVAKEDCSVLIEGETGTGKELIATAIHNHSSRNKAPIMAINCGAFPKDLIQAELFGHEKGAFTGAHQQKIGRIESAQGGTLFLDEIGDLPIEQQTNLLRFLEERTITRVGGSAKIPIDIRIIAATHVDLKQAVQNKSFREDLYYRLKVLQLKTPPLRERNKDIELMARYYFNKFSSGQNYKAKGFNAEALTVLKNHEWPGNVRELMNCIRHGIIMSENRLLTPSDLDLDRRRKERVQKTLEDARAEADRESIIHTMRLVNSNKSLAAELLGITRVSLYRLITKYQLEI